MLDVSFMKQLTQTEDLDAHLISLMMSQMIGTIAEIVKKLVNRRNLCQQ